MQCHPRGRRARRLSCTAPGMDMCSRGRGSAAAACALPSRTWSQESRPTQQAVSRGDGDLAWLAQWHRPSGGCGEDGRRDLHAGGEATGRAAQRMKCGMGCAAGCGSRQGKGRANGGRGGEVGAGQSWVGREGAGGGRRSGRTRLAFREARWAVEQGSTPPPGPPRNSNPRVCGSW